jgi:hypothetical protein
MGQANLGKVRGDDGENVYIKYNSAPSDENATNCWTSGQMYIGVRTSMAKTKPATGYAWAKFCGDDGVNGTNGENFYFKYNTIDSDTGATPEWTAGQRYIGFTTSDAPTAPETGYDWVEFIPEIKQTTGTSTADIMSQNAVTNAIEGIRSGIDATTVGISASSGTKYYFGRTVSGTVSGTAEVVLTNCAGTVTLSGNTAKLYIRNCPKLTVNGVTYTNRKNLVYNDTVKAKKYNGNTGTIYRWEYGENRDGLLFIAVCDAASGNAQIRNKLTGAVIATIDAMSGAVITLSNHMLIRRLFGNVTEGTEWGQSDYSGGFYVYINGTDVTVNIVELSNSTGI